MTLPAFAVERRAVAPMLLGAGAVGRYFLLARRSAANPPLLLSIDGTDECQLHPTCSAFYAGSAKDADEEL